MKISFQQVGIYCIGFSSLMNIIASFSTSSYFSSLNRIFILVSLLSFFSSLLSGIQNNNHTGYRCLQLWSLISIFYGILSADIAFSEALMRSYLIPFFLIPFFFIGINNLNIGKIVRCVLFFDVIYLVLTIYFISCYSVNNYLSNVSFVEYSGKGIVYANILLLFLTKKLNKKETAIVFFTHFIGLYLAMFEGRRSMLFILSLSLIIFFIIRTQKEKRKMHQFFMIAILFIGTFCIYTIYDKTGDIGVFAQLKDRMEVDSRKSVNNDFKRDFTFFDYLIGRGVGGTFKTVESGLGEYSFLGTYRTGIETGYLDYILKGGLIYLILFLFICWKAFFRCYRYITDKSIGYAFLIYIFLYVLDIFISGSADYNLRSFILWFCVCKSLKKEYYGKKNINIE